MVMDVVVVGVDMVIIVIVTVIIGDAIVAVVVTIIAVVVDEGVNIITVVVCCDRRSCYRGLGHGGHSRGFSCGARCCDGDR